MRTHTHTHMHAHTHSHAHAHTHTRTHTCTFLQGRCMIQPSLMVVPQGGVSFHGIHDNHTQLHTHNYSGYSASCVPFSPPRLPLLLQPYLHSLHNSPVKCQVVYSDLKPDIWQLIEKAGSLQNSVTHPARMKVSMLTHTHTHAHTCAHTHTRTHTRARTHTHAHTHTHTHAHTVVPFLL